MQVETDTQPAPFAIPTIAVSPENGSSTPAPSSSSDEQAPLITLSHKASGASPFPLSDYPQTRLLIHRARAVQAVHRLWSKSLTEQQNASRYGALAMGVHGHTYVFEVKFRGPLCKAT